MRPKADEEGSNKMSIDILVGSSRLQLHYIMIIIYVGRNADCWPLLRKRFRVQANCAARAPLWTPIQRKSGRRNRFLRSYGVARQRPALTPLITLTRARARPWSARCYGVARQRDRSRQNSTGASGVLSLRHFGLARGCRTLW